MSDIFATLAAGTSRPTSGAGGDTAVRVIDPSPDLSRLALGESLRGTVVGKDDQGHLLVRTRLGVLNLAATRNLPVGSDVVLQVRSVGPQVLLNLLPLDSAGTAALQGGTQTQALPPLGGAAAQPALPPNPPVNPQDLVQRGQLLRGVLHAAPPMPALAGLPTAQPGTDLIVRILSLGVQSQAVSQPGTPAGTPPAAGQPAGQTGPTGAVLPGVPGTPAQGAAPAQPGAPVAPAGTAGATPTAGPVSGSQAAAPQPGAVPPPVAPGNTSGPAPPEASPGLRLAPQVPVSSSGHTVATALQGLSAEAAAKAAGAPASGSTAPAPIPGAAPGAVPGAGPSATTAPVDAGSLRVTGLVTATTSGGQPILHTPLGTVTLDTRAALPQGTSLALEVTLPAAGRAPAEAGLLAAWPSLGSLQETLLHGLPAAQAELVAHALPQVGPRLASGVLFFLTALNQGNVAGWLAKAAGSGEAGDRSELPGGLADRLGREIAGLSRSIETPAGEWRFIHLPLWSDQGLRELRCFFRHQEHGGSGQRDGEKATRFVLEVELRQHGELQLDGLVRPRQFDLVLRSRRALPALVRGDLMALFEETNAIAGYNGRLSFQASTDWMQLLAARSTNEPHEGLKV